MKIFAFVDMHGSLTALRSIRSLVKKRNPDVIICAGDISIFEDGLLYLVGKIASFKLPVLMIPGNHESDQSLKTICSAFKNVHFTHKKVYRFKNYVFICWGGGGFAQTDKAFESFADAQMKKVKSSDKIILITHGPPYQTKLDELYGDYVGNKSYTNFIKKYKPDLAISGHIHETACRNQKYGKTLLSNPGPKGKIFVV